MRERRISRFLPFLLSIAIIVLDQVTKAWIVKTIPENTIGYSFFSDFLWIVHVRNTAIAFSMGDSLPVMVKYIFFIGLPFLLMVALGYLVVSRKMDKEITALFRDGAWVESSEEEWET